jgi:hypothetical protein
VPGGRVGSGIYYDLPSGKIALNSRIKLDFSLIV